MGLKNFQGTKRRFEFIGSKKGISLYDDYAHHPSELKVTLKAARHWFPDRKIIAVFQPHTYTRTQALFKDFARAFQDADEVLITDIYASAREEPIPGVNSRRLVQAIKKIKPKIYYCPGKKEVLSYLQENVFGKEVVITFGAGSIFQWHSEILKAI